MKEKKRKRKKERENEKEEKENGERKRERKCWKVKVGRVKRILAECNSKNCPVHGNLRTRGMVFEGRVVSAKSKNTAVIEVSRLHKVRKYERLEKRRSRIHIHVPPCMQVKEGEVVKAAECRKISKTKSHVLIK